MAHMLVRNESTEFFRSSRPTGAAGARASRASTSLSRAPRAVSCWVSGSSWVMRRSSGESVPSSLCSYLLPADNAEYAEHAEGVPWYLGLLTTLTPFRVFRVLRVFRVKVVPLSPSSLRPPRLHRHQRRE